MRLKNLIASVVAGLMLSSTPVMATEVWHDEAGIYVRISEATQRYIHCYSDIFTKRETKILVDPCSESEGYSCGKDVRLNRVGYRFDWTIVQVDGVNYFVKSDDLTKQEPESWEEFLLPEENSCEYTGYYGTAYITAYCPGACCCGKWAGSNTSSGTVPTAGRTVACNNLPAGTHIYIDGVGERIVEDTGWSPYSPWIDLYFDSHAEASAWGLQIREVWTV